MTGAAVGCTGDRLTGERVAGLGLGDPAGALETGESVATGALGAMGDPWSTAPTPPTKRNIARPMMMGLATLFRSFRGMINSYQCSSLSVTVCRYIAQYVYNGSISVQQLAG